MNYLVSPLAAGTYVIAIEDKLTWDVPTYTNLYVLQREGQIILIDAGLKQYQPAITKALTEIGVSCSAVTHILLTHGHRDHVDGMNFFVNAKIFAHAADLPLMGRALASKIVPFVSGENAFSLGVSEINNLDIILVNTHTPGSVAIYDYISKALFVGDFFCFWGEPLPDGLLVSYSEASRQGSNQYVATQATSGGKDFNRFMLGLSRVLAYQPDFFCTGHGVVLRDDIQGFLKSLSISGSQRKD